MNLDYESLRLIYWALLVAAVLAFTAYEGLALGTSMLLSLVCKTDAERQTVIAKSAPTTLGQQAWLVACIALLFAAWPIAYAVLLSSLESIALLMLIAWMIRPIGLYFRAACHNPSWLRNWDKALAVSGIIPSALLGIIAGNLLKGVPFHLDSDMRIFFLGDFWGLLNPFTLLVAAVSVALLLMYGAAYLQLKCEGEIQIRSKAFVYKSGAAFLILFALTGLWVTRLEGYHITSEIFTDASSNPLSKFVKRADGLWLDNYEHEPSLWAIPILAFIGVGVTLYFSKLKRHQWAFIASALTVVMSALTEAVSMFPFLLPSNRSLNSSLTIWDASASQQTLTALLWFLLAALPLLIFAGRLAFRVVPDDTPCEEEACGNDDQAQKGDYT